MKHRSWIVLVTTLFVGLAFGLAVASAHNGPEELSIHAGKKGTVLLKHRLHQTTLGDCNACHDMFSKKIGAIGELIAAGTLKPKKVMNTKCVACHKQMKKAGEKTGPTTCKGCHK